MSKVRALVLLSGGLDSMLSAKILQTQGIEVEGICFESNFYNANKARISAEQIGIKLHVIDIRLDILKLTKNPPHGYGKNMNPCIDCHGMMFQKAGEFAKKNNFDFIATGEVLGQRPFSQNKNALGTVSQIAGIEILRPLSAKLLPETEVEKNGLVKRYKLYNIEGRSRERQIKLVEDFGIKKYPSPAGGCLLTDPDFSERLMKMLEFWPNCDNNDVELLKHGRVFWFEQTRIEQIEDTNKANESFWTLVVIGRHKEDNEVLEKLAKENDVLIEIKDDVGPLTVIRIFNFQFSIFKQFSNEIILNIPEKLKKSELKLNETKNIDKILHIASLLTGWYATKVRGKKVKLEVRIKK